ncbi:hypothetical protein Raf01_11680 [Rugosimonospora africana]|uniref:CU044_5270 family protein n=1 Tax=Rugosimonospora africana TaxID=556532 RepID=A0A8J3QPW6_9ACTN|nr:hypothetical protein Raf01_11680 [Rugosimonospora africana]
MDEMDLLSQLKDVPPLRSEAYEQARATLRSAMVESGAAPVRAERFSWVRNFRVGVLGKVGIGAIGAVAAAVAVATVATSTPRSAAPAGAAAGSASKAPAVSSRLVSLASDITATDGPLPGDASLVIRTQTVANRAPYVTYNLYTDGGDVYVTDTEGALPAAIAHHDNLAEPEDSREVAAARLAATGDLAKAREQMVNATANPWGLGLSPAAAQEAWDKAMAEEQRILREKGVTRSPRPRPTGKALEDGINNVLWTNSVDALARGAEDPDVRAGVLRLLSTIPEVTVADSTTGGQPTLTITAGPAIFGDSAQEVLTINATTGLPVSSAVSPAPGQDPADATPPSLETYQSSRVTLANIEAGKF